MKIKNPTQYLTKSGKLNSNWKKLIPETYNEETFVEDLYNTINVVDNKSCSVCGNKKKFNGFSKGYSSTCNSQKCISEYIARKTRGRKHTDEWKRKASNSHKGKRCPSRSEGLKKYYQSEKGKETKKLISKSSKSMWKSDEYRKKHREKMLNAIESGKFTPCITNTWTHWTFEVDGKKFRSSFEGIYYLYHVKYLGNPLILYEHIRIPYEFEKKNHIYITDFYHSDTNTIVEIKPDSRKNINKNLIKYKYAKEYATKHEMKFETVSEHEIFKMAKQMLDDDNFTNQALTLFEEKYERNLSTIEI